MLHNHHIRLSLLICFWGYFCCFAADVAAQKNSIVSVHADKVSGYGVAFGGPDLIVTALHVVAGKKTITVKWQGKEVPATVQKIYKPSDLALLKLKTPLGIPQLSLYSGEPPWDTDINYWELPVNATGASGKTTQLEERTTLAKMSPRLINNSAGLEKALCSDGGQYYPGMSTEVINFKEPNIRKAHSGSPLTYGDKILGMIDGGSKLVNGNPCVWAISGSDFNKLIKQGTPPSSSMASCETSGSENKYMYSGTRSDNPHLTPEEAENARQFESAAAVPLTFSDASGNSDTLSLYAEYRMSFAEIFESLFDGDQQSMIDLFSEETTFDQDQQLSLDDLMNQTMDIHQEEWTGVSLAIPAEFPVTSATDAFGTFLSISSPSEAITLSFYISRTATPEAALGELARFKEMLKNMGQSVDPRSDKIEDFSCDVNNPYYRESIENSVLDDNGQLTSEFFAELVVNESDFLGVTVIVSDWNTVWNDPKERRLFYLMESCAMLADFALY